MRAPLTVTFHIGGKQVDKLTELQCEKMAQRMSEAMSIYYTAHPEEYIKLNKASKKEIKNEKAVVKNIGCNNNAGRSSDRTYRGM